LSQRAALGFYAGLMGLVLLSACAPMEGLVTPTPGIFAAPQDRAPVSSAQPINTSNDFNLLYVTDRAPIRIPRRTRSPMGPSARTR
jgi:hypothetical protein